MEYFLTCEDVIESCKVGLERYKGGNYCLFDFGRLEATVEGVKLTSQLAGLTLQETACAYLFNITTAHLFEQGNKRAAVFATDYFLMRNGYEVTLHNDVYKQLSLDIAAGTYRTRQEIESLLTIDRLK